MRSWPASTNHRYPCCCGRPCKGRSVWRLVACLTLDPDRVRGGRFLMRSAGCVINDYADRNFDGHVKRTAGRPLPWAGRRAEMLVLFAVLALLSFGLVLTIEPAHHRSVVCRSAAGGLLPLHEAPSPSPAGARGRPSPVHSHGLCGAGQCPAAGSPGCCFLPTCCGPSPMTTGSTPWWTGDDDLKIGPKSAPSCSAVTTNGSSARAATRPFMICWGRAADGVGIRLLLGIAGGGGAVRLPAAD